MPKQLMYVNHETNEVMTGREARKRYRKRYAADPKLKYFDVSYCSRRRFHGDDSGDSLSEKRKGLYLYCSRLGRMQHLRVKGYQARHSRSS